MKVMADSKGSGMKSEANSGNYVMEIKGGSKAQPVTSNTDSVMSTVKCDLRSLLVSSKDGILSADLQGTYLFFIIKVKQISFTQNVNFLERNKVSSVIGLNLC